ncbi:PAS domain S-box protein [Halorientalis litorea]|uniref:PAS domain S-box protein n=1 Tax=Halorientalis litorea TaxID=2931977 RepID=UPI001FF584B6|nr:PAS domain S-box protein [Halorientalis litorea]
MVNTHPSSASSASLLFLSAEIGQAETVSAAVTRAVELAETAFDQPAVSVCDYDSNTDTVSTLASSGRSSDNPVTAPDRIPESVIQQSGERGGELSADATPEATVDTDPPGSTEAEVFVPAGCNRTLHLGVTDPAELDDEGVTVTEAIAAHLETALARIDGHQSVDHAARALFEEADDAAFLSDDDGVIVAVSPAAREMTGYDRETLLGRNVADIAHEPATGAVREYLDTSVAGTPDPLRTTLERADESDVTVELTSTTVEVDGSSYVRTTVQELSRTTQTDPRQTAAEPKLDAGLLRRLNELTVAAEAFDETIERLLSLGCDHLGLDTGILSHVDEDDYEVEAVVDATGTHRAGAVYELQETMCHATLANETTETLAFADAADTDYESHPAAENVRAYIGVPVVVDGRTYGTVNFSMAKPRPEPFSPGEREFAKLVAQWVGTEIERRHRFEELERYEAILEAVDDPVYALDTEGRFTFVNDAAKREFGYDSEIIGKRPSATMDDSDVERIRNQIADLLATDDRSTTAEFTLETVDGSRLVVENQLALIDNDEFRGTAGVLRDITARNERRQQLESFQQAIESARDGVAVLEDGEYVFIDQSHVDMYGFEDKQQLLGHSWRELYDEDEVERLQAEAFPTLEADGYWRGMVTGSRPDGSTFPAELSLTMVEDGRLVCTVRDETERQTRERELELKEQAMNEATVGIQITDPTRADNPLVYVNDGFERVTGYTSEEVLGRNPRFLQGPNTDPAKEARLREAVDAEEPVSLELRNYRKDGTEYWTRLSLTPVTDEEGTVQNFVGISQDVTERRERSQWLQQFLSHGPLLFVQTREVDGEAVVASCNEQFRTRLGYDRGEIVGEPLEHFYTALSTSKLTGGGYEDALTGEFEVAERRLLGANGEQVDTLLRAVPRRDETTGTNALFVDISERKQRERQNKARIDLIERVYEVTTDPETAFEEKISMLLDAVSDHLDLPYGFLTRIETDAEPAAGTQTIVDSFGSHDRLQPDESVPLSQSYCRETIERDEPMALIHATEDGWADDPAYETFELETYLGADVAASGDLYGTLCFAATEPRADPFDEFERSFISLVGQWIGYEMDRRETHDDLREQRQRLELTLSGTNTGLAEWDVETDTVTWNETLVDIVGRDVESVEGFVETVHPDDRARVRENLERITETGESWVDEFRTTDGDGTVRWLGTRAVPTYDDEGNLTRVLATGMDITDRKNAERQRERNERRYRRLAENIPNGAVLTFDTDLEYDLAAGELLSAFDRDASDISGMAVGTVFPDVDARDELVARSRAALDGERTDRRVQLDDRTVRIQIVPVDYSDGQSTETHGLLLAQDVTEEVRRERELRAERERFRLLTESVDEYVFLAIGEDGTIQTWDDSAENTFGYDAEAAVGMAMAELYPDSDRESGLPERLLQQARIAGESAHEGQCARVDGTTFYGDTQFAPLEADDGEFRGYAMIVRDMTDRRRQRRRTERFVEESDDVVTILEADGTVAYASGSAERVFDYDPDDLVGENLFDYLHPDGREHALKMFYDCVDGAKDVTAECRLASPDGGWFNVEGHYRNMLDDEAIDGILVYLRNVTERTERARRFESIFNQTFQFTGLLKPDGTLAEANDATLEFAGVERDSIIGKPLPEAPWWGHSETARNGVRDAIARAANGEFVRYETEARGANGLATIDFSIKPVTDEDGTVSLLVTEGRDVTARQQYRQHLEVMQRVLRHNMRNDLTKIRGWTQLMSETADADARAEQFETIETVLDKWDAMSNKISEIRQVLGKQEKQQATTGYESLLLDVEHSVKDTYPDATVVTDVPDGESAQVPVETFEAVRELVENGIDASNHSTVEIELAAPEGGWVELSVSDDGPGMPEMEAEVLEKGEETSLRHGQGLGLWMARTIVRQAGGDVSVDTGPDGTEVCVRLPTETARSDKGVPGR